MEWINVKRYYPENYGEQVVVFSPAYPVGNSMRFRIMDAQFVKMCGEVTHWAKLEAPEDHA